MNDSPVLMLSITAEASVIRDCIHLPQPPRSNGSEIRRVPFRAGTQCRPQRLSTGMNLHKGII
jgi:hypothetical protein